MKAKFLRPTPQCSRQDQNLSLASHFQNTHLKLQQYLHHPIIAARRHSDRLFDSSKKVDIKSHPSDPLLTFEKKKNYQHLWAPELLIQPRLGFTRFLLYQVGQICTSLDRQRLVETTLPLQLPGEKDWPT